MTAMSDALAGREFVALDLETTGLSRQQGRIVEFGAVRFRLDGTESGRMSLLANPGCRIPYPAWRVHGISDAMVRDQPPVEEALPRFLEFCGDAGTVLLAHNASFDVGFLKAAIQRSGLAAPEHLVFDNLRLARARLPELASHRLESLSTAFRIAPRVEHRALSDSLLLKSIFLKTLAREPAVCTLAELRRVCPPLRFTKGQSPPARGARGPNPAEEVGSLPLPSVWRGEREPVGAGKVCSDHEERLLRAIRARQALEMIYEGGSKGLVRRSVTPRSLAESQGVTYLRAFCHADLREKVYRLDRIRELHDPEAAKNR